MHYTLPVSDSFALKVVEGKRPTTIVTPLTVKLTGEGIKEMGVEDQVQARIYQVTGLLSMSKSKALDPFANDRPTLPTKTPDSRKQPRSWPKVYDRMYWVLGLTFGIMALGGTLLFRKGPA